MSAAVPREGIVEDRSPGAAAPAEVRPWVGRVARLMDSVWRVPGTNIRFGLDPLVGLVPVLGDTATMLVGIAMLREARRLRAPKALMGQMIANLAIDWLAGLTPGVDLVLDTMVKAHSRNARLLEAHAEQSRRGQH